MNQITNKLLSETKKEIINSLNFYVLGRGYFNFSKTISEGMCHSQSIYDAVTEFDNSLGMPRKLMEFRKDSFIKRLIDYVDKWIFYNETSWEEENSDIVKWLFENVEPANIQ